MGPTLVGGAPRLSWELQEASRRSGANAILGAVCQGDGHAATRLAVPRNFHP